MIVGAVKKLGGKRKIWFTKLIINEFPSGNKSGGPGDNKPNAGKEMKTNSPWKAGKSKTSGTKKR